MHQVSPVAAEASTYEYESISTPWYRQMKKRKYVALPPVEQANIYQESPATIDLFYPDEH